MLLSYVRAEGVETAFIAQGNDNAADCIVFNAQRFYFNSMFVSTEIRSMTLISYVSSANEFCLMASSRNTQKGREFGMRRAEHSKCKSYCDMMRYCHVAVLINPPLTFSLFSVLWLFGKASSQSSVVAINEVDDEPGWLLADTSLCMDN